MVSLVVASMVNLVVVNMDKVAGSIISKEVAVASTINKAVDNMVSKVADSHNTASSKVADSMVKGTMVVVAAAASMGNRVEDDTVNKEVDNMVNKEVTGITTQVCSPLFKLHLTTGLRKQSFYD